MLAHAMFARRSEFERPSGDGLSAWLAERGWRTCAFDFRGHGESGPPAGRGGAWGYDDLVMLDLPAVVGSLRARAGALPVIVVGHSLGGHVALAAAGTRTVHVDGLVLAASNVWLPEDEPSRLRWIAKRGTATLIDAVCRRRGFFPARALRLGSDDEAGGYMTDLTRFIREGVWTSRDGGQDYRASVANVRIPVVTIASRGDTFNCPPASAARFVERVRGPMKTFTVEIADDGGAPPDHMALVTGPSARRQWGQALAWMEEHVSPSARA